MARRRVGVNWLLLALVVSLPPATVGPAGRAAAAPAASLQRYAIIPGESQVIYRVGEALFLENNRFNVAVGTTTALRGEILVDRTAPKNSRIGTITVDISQFRSDSQRRDNFIRTRSLESARFPLAEFTPTTIEGLPDSYVDGRDVALEITGTLKIRTVTRPTTFAATIRLDGTTLTGTATTLIRMTDFAFDPPAILGILRTENEVRLEFRIVARAAP